MHSHSLKQIQFFLECSTSLSTAIKQLISHFSTCSSSFRTHLRRICPLRMAEKVHKCTTIKINRIEQSPIIPNNVYTNGEQNGTLIKNERELQRTYKRIQRPNFRYNGIKMKSLADENLIRKCCLHRMKAKKLGHQTLLAFKSPCNALWDRALAEHCWKRKCGSEIRSKFNSYVFSFETHRTVHSFIRLLLQLQRTPVGNDKTKMKLNSFSGSEIKNPSNLVTINIDRRPQWPKQKQTHTVTHATRANDEWENKKWIKRATNNKNSTKPQRKNSTKPSDSAFTNVFLYFIALRLSTQSSRSSPSSAKRRKKTQQLNRKCIGSRFVEFSFLSLGFTVVLLFEALKSVCLMLPRSASIKRP